MHAGRMQTSEGPPPASRLVKTTCLPLFEKRCPSVPPACLLTPCCDPVVCLYASLPMCHLFWFLDTLACFALAHPPTNKLASRCVQNVPWSHGVHQAGRKASMSSLPAPPYLLIKELLNSQKLQRVQERSMHSNTIRKHHIFLSSPPSIYMHLKFLSSSQTFPHWRSCILFGAYKCEIYKLIQKNSRFER